MVLDSKDFPNPPFEEMPSTGLELPSRRVLRQLANKLKSGMGKHGSRCGLFAEGIDAILYEDRSSSSSISSPKTSQHLGSPSSSPEDLNGDEEKYFFNKQYQDIMAEELVRAINDKKKLRLASLVPCTSLGKPKTTCP